MFSGTLKKFLSEPLVQFFMLGGLVFAADAWWSDSEDLQAVVIDDKQFEELETIFREGQGREPSANELSNMMVKWAQNEIMYREALQMGLDKGDEMMRNRLILKMHSVLFNRFTPEPPSRFELEQFFEANRARYDKPNKIDFEQFYIPTAENLSQAQSLAEQLQDADVPAEYLQGFMQYQVRPESNLLAMFGEQGAASLFAVPQGYWAATGTARGFHLARITRAYPAEPVNLADVELRVQRDWKKFQRDLQLATQTVEIASKYKLAVELSEQKKARLEKAETLQERFRHSIESPARQVNTASASR